MARYQPYSRIAGQSIERLAALSDGVFAVAMTLLVLDLKNPAAETIQGEAALAAALVVLLPRLLIYLLSFLLLGIFWVGQQTQLNHVAKGDRELAWIHLAFLFFVSITPFSTSLMAEFVTFRIALLLYWLNIVCLGATLFLAWCHTETAGLLAPDFDAARGTAIKRRIVVAQAFYATGAALCLIDTRVSLGAILLAQLYFAIGPEWPLNRRDRPLGATFPCQAL